MKAQFKYALKQSLTFRATAFGALVIMNLVFGILGYFRLWGYGGLVTATVFSSIAFCGIIAVRAIVDGRNFKDIFGTPDGYLHALTPVKSWKLLLSRSVVMVFEDLLALFVGIFGIVWQGLVLSGEIGLGINSGAFVHIRPQEVGYIILMVILMILGYAYLMMFGIFGASLKNSVLFGVRGRTFLAVLGVAAVAWVFNLFNFIVAPFGEVIRWKWFFQIEIPGGFYTAFAVYFILYFAKAAALFVASSILMERKNNL